MILHQYALRVEQMVVSLSAAIQLLCRRRIRISDVDDADRALRCFISASIANFGFKKIARKSNFHRSLHIKQTIVDFGPLPVTWY